VASASASGPRALESSAPSGGDAPAEVRNEFASYSGAALICECIERHWLGYTCNNAYLAVEKLFPDDATTIRALMKLAVRVDAGEPYGGEAEVTHGCNLETKEGAAYPCLYTADGDPTPRGKAAHALACKGAPPEGQVPIAGGSLACDGDRPVRIAPLPKREADDVRRCFACGYDPKLSPRDLSDIPKSAKACTAVAKRASRTEASFIEKSIAPLCPSGS